MRAANPLKAVSLSIEARRYERMARELKTTIDPT